MKTFTAKTQPAKSAGKPWLGKTDQKILNIIVNTTSSGLNMIQKLGLGTLNTKRLIRARGQWKSPGTNGRARIRQKELRT
jgi:hypothetical protein